MSVTIRIQTQGLDETQRGLQQIIALQREVAATAAGIRFPRVSPQIASAGQAAARASTNFRDFSQEIAGIERPVNTLQQRLVAFRQANAQLANSLGLPINAIRNLNQAFGTIPNRTAEIVRRFIEFRDAGADVNTTFRQLNQEFGITADQFTELSNTVGASTQALGALAVQAGAVATAVQRIFAQGLQDFIAFDSILRSIQAITGQTAEDLETLEAEIVRLGSTTQFSNTQVATAAQGLLRLGFNAEEVEAALGGIVDGARASGESLETVSAIVATTINQFDELTAASATGVSDVLAATANNSAVSIADLGQALSFVGTAANDFNQTAEDTAATIGLLADTGLPASRAGRNLATALTRLQTAAADNTEDFQRLGVSLVDAQGEFRPLLDLIPEIRDNLNQLDDLDRINLIQSLFGAEGGRAFRALLSRTNEDIETLRTTVNNAAGSAAIAGETLTQGLGGALSNLSSASETASASIGRVLAPAAEAVVRAASSLVQAFNALPAPIQSALVATTGFVGVLSAAVAAVAAYTAANNLLNLSQTRLALSTVANTVATNADTAAKTLNTIATTNLISVAGALPALLRAQAAGFAASAAGAGGFIAALAPAIALFAGVAAAIGTTTIALSRFRDEGEALREGNNDVSASLAELSTEAETVERALEGVSNTDPVPTDVIDRVVNLANAFNAVVNNALGFPEDLFRIRTNADNRIDDISLAISDARAEANALSDASLELAQTLNRGFADSPEGLAEFEAALTRAADLQNIFDDEIEDARRQLATLDAEALGSEAYEQLSGEIEANISILIRQREVLEGQVNAARLAAAGVEDVGNQAKLSRDELEQLTEALEEQRDELRATAEEEFRISVQAEDEAFRDRQRAEEQAFQDQLNAENEAFADRQRSEERAFERELQESERSFDAQQEQSERQLQEDLQNRESTFNRAEEGRRRQFEAEQNRLREQFETELADRRSANEAEVAGLRQDVERQIQLEQADSDQARQELEERFANEDEIATRRAELLAPVLERERELQEELREAERAFQEEEQARADAFLAEEEARRETFEAKLATIREQSEAEIESRRLAFEDQLDARKQAFEDGLGADRDAFEDGLEARRQSFADSQRAEQAAFDDRQRAAEAEFREEQRRLDEQSAARIQEIQSGTGLVEEIRATLEDTDIPSTERAQAVKDILESVNIPGVSGNVPGFRTGGIAPGGVIKAGEVGPEFLIPPKNSRVLSRGESRKAVQQAVERNPSLAQGMLRRSQTQQRELKPTLASPTFKAVTPDNTSPLLRTQLAVMQNMNQTESRMLKEINQVRRRQEKSLSASNRFRSNSNNESGIDLLLGAGLL